MSSRPALELSIAELARHEASIQQISAHSIRYRQLRRHLDHLRRNFSDVQRRLRTHQPPPEAARAVEWLLDNEHLIAESLNAVRETLTRRFWKQLPIVTSAGRTRAPRTYVLARLMVRVGHGHVDAERVRQFLDAFGPPAPLNMGELWALPAMLRLVLLEDLAAGAMALTGAAERVERSNWSGIPQAASADAVGTYVQSLRTLVLLDWLDFFEAVSRTHAVLAGDGAAAYAQMDFDSRDRYRKAVEQFARRNKCTEEHVARVAIELSHRNRNALDKRAAHVGFYLVDDGRNALQTALTARISPNFATHKKQLRLVLYFSLMLITTLTGIYALSLPVAASGVLAITAALCCGLIPAVSVAVAVVNWLVSHTVPPHLLPKLDFEKGIPDGYRTAVVIPAILREPEDVIELLAQLELNYQGNADPMITFALLTDLADAPACEMPADAKLLQQLKQGVVALNERYSGTGPDPFALLHRERTWNAAENCWMGWERKRGKLTEFNRYVLTGKSGLRVHIGDGDALRNIRFVITLDADTFIPAGAARRLIGTAAHPLNRPVFDASDRVTAGYTVLQPRIEIQPSSAAETLFARVYQADRGLDLYSRAVSDVYQDLFGEGSFAGKGIYDVAAFEQSLAGRVPSNALLSHDLFEGIHGRAGLVSDIVVLEDFPSHVLTYARRLHRWVRGDWQILPWLLPRVPTELARWSANRLTMLDRWKIVDNLRRSLLAPSLVTLLIAGWLLFPAAALAWTLAALLVLGVPIALGAATAGRHWARARRWGLVALNPGSSIRMDLLQWALTVIFLPFYAAVQFDAIVRTLYRLLVSRQKMLEWTSAAHALRAARTIDSEALTWRQMASAPVLAVVLLITLGVPQQASELPPAIMLGCWLVSPAVAFRISRRKKAEPEGVDEADLRLLRVLARRTWAFFERFVGPNDHWLPPDHYQETPRPALARRTSPTNTGLLAASTVVAYDMGYLPVTRMAALLDSTLDTIETMERYRGHLLNWYRTDDLTPLEPRYVSTVDSGNLAGCLLIVASACVECKENPIVRSAAVAGLADALSILQENVAKVGDGRSEMHEVRRVLDQVAAELKLRPAAGERAQLLADLADRHVPAIEAALITLVEARTGAFAAHELAELRGVLRGLNNQVITQRDELATLAPWLILPVQPPSDFGAVAGPAVTEAWQRLRAVGELHIELVKIPELCETASRIVSDLNKSANHNASAQGATWLQDFAGKLEKAAAAARSVITELESIRQRAEAIVTSMDFGFLYDKRRDVFHIGYNVSAGRLDPNYYDLLASEARLSSLIAIAKHDVPPRHWLHLGRPFRRVADGPILLSWGGSMFEYLLPSLIMKLPHHSLLALACNHAIDEQIRFGRHYSIPWGMSESAYNELDVHGTYQYRSFGVPALAMRRDPAERLTVTPYASLLALPLRPRKVVANVKTLVRYGLIGAFGVYEALDYGHARKIGSREPHRVKSYMAHHQGMILLALGRFFGSPITDRFHARAAIAAAEFLLHEQIPRRTRFEPLMPAPALAPIEIGPPPPVEAWPVNAVLSDPQAVVISNAELSTLVTGRGGGGIRRHETAVTRWQADPSCEIHGIWCYFMDRDSGASWSPTDAPTFTRPEQSEVYFAPYTAEFHRREHGISSRCEITVAADAPVDVRKLTLLNESQQSRQLMITSCGEVVLAPSREDRRHPAFSKLFVESAYDPARTILTFQRRTAAVEAVSLHLAHAAVASKGAQFVGFETDRRRFVGRNRSYRSPLAIEPTTKMSGTTGATLDPIFALAYNVELEPGAEVELAYLTATGASEREARAHLEMYRTLGGVSWAFDQARVRSEHELHDLGIAPNDAHQLARILSMLLYPFNHHAPKPEPVEEPRAYQQALWGLGISGDLPVLLLRVPPTPEAARPVLDFVIRAHAYWRRSGVRADLLILDEEPGGYTESLREWLLTLLSTTGGSHWLSRPGGVFHIPVGRLSNSDRYAIERAATVCIDGARPLSDQLLRRRPPELPEFIPMPSAPLTHESTAALERPHDLLFDNGLGGFAPDTGDYVMHLEAGQAPPPAPWINVIANSDFGFTISEAGSGFTWRGNSGEHRLSPWSNDPVMDPPGEALYLRDEETAAIWSATPQPMPAGTAYQVRHGMGYTLFQNQSHGLAQQARFFVPKDGPVKIVQVTLRNLRQRQRRITLTYYVEWVLGAQRRHAAKHVCTHIDHELGAVLAEQPFTGDFTQRIAFLSSSESIHGATADRTEFLGENGDIRDPAALHRIGLSGRFGAGLDPCAALQVHIDLPPGETRQLHFLLGEAAEHDQVGELIRRFKAQPQIEAALGEVTTFWQHLLGSVQVRTPEPAMDVLLNRWLPYQALACRVWARSALYQSSGAFGFRDQLQDVSAFMLSAPCLTRNQILLCAARQFREGDVLHWWHPPGDRGVRTRCSDDLVWLPYLTALYVGATGDDAILSEPVPFLEGAPLDATESEHYDHFGRSAESATVYEHCIRALERAATVGSHGLPLIGTGDWNDGMNRVGAAGRGESVWLAWFLYDVLSRFAPLCRAQGDEARGHALQARADQLRVAVESTAWDGDWYRRAYFDDGTSLGSAANREARIDSLPQTWSVLSNGADSTRARAAMDAVHQFLIREEHRLVLLLDPPFDTSLPSPGYIRAYPPGIRENGGQYTHAAVWVAWAFAKLGDGDRAERLFRILNPIHRTTSLIDVQRYCVEPYVVAADVYGAAPHTGRGGWTWYTGSAAWMYRLGVEAILGLQRTREGLHIDPCIPKDWRAYDITVRFGKTEYQIHISNPHGVSRGVAHADIDGTTLTRGVVELRDDGLRHVVNVRLGDR